MYASVLRVVRSFRRVSYQKGSDLIDEKKKEKK